jgi:hypothetical protein
MLYLGLGFRVWGLGMLYSGLGFRVVICTCACQYNMYIHVHRANGLVQLTTIVLLAI